MATFNLETSINALPDTPVLPCYQEHPVVQSKILDFAAFKHLGPREVYAALSSFITSMDMLVIAHSDTAQPVPMHQMTLEALTQAMRTRMRSEAQALLGDEHVNVFEDLKAMVDIGDDSSAQAMVELQQLCLRSVLESLSCASVKKGALFLSPFTQKPLLLLGSRGLFVTDKSRIAAANAKANKAKKASGKAAKKKSSKKSGSKTVNPQGKPRRTISDAEEEDGNLSNTTVDDVSCHGGDGDSPYDSEWAHSQHSSTHATPILASQPQPEDPVQLTLTPVGPSSIAPVIDDEPRIPMNIQLASNPLVPLIPPGVLGSPNPLGGTLGSVPLAAVPLKIPAKKRSKKQSKKKSKKSKKSRSRSRSRSSSSSSISSIEIPQPKPSADQVFCCVFTSHLV